MSKANALTIICKRIIDLSSEVPLSHRDDDHKLKFLRAAVIGKSCARGPLRRVATDNINFQELLAKLDIAIQLANETENEAASDQPGQSPVRINFNGEGRSHHVQPERLKFNYNVSEKKRQCFNCISEEHLVRNFPHPVNYTRSQPTTLNP